MYISNENATAVDVYFDDITMTYTPTNVIQYNEYYPFGLQTADSWTRDNASNSFLYNEGSELNKVSGFYDLPFRNYDASLGRFFQIDPLSYLDNATSPFAYASNNPVEFTDPTGLMISSAGLSDYQLRMMYRRDMASYLSYDDWASQNIIEYAAGKGFDNMGGSGGSTWGSWVVSNIFVINSRKPRYEPNGTHNPEYGYEWTYVPGTGRSPFDQVQGDPAVSSAGSPQGTWSGKAITIIIHHGSAEDKGAGGKLGGHVMINFGDNDVYGFTGWGVKRELDENGQVQFKEVPLMPAKNPHNPSEWFSSIHGNDYYGDMNDILSGNIKDGGAVSIFKIPVTEEQYNDISGWYKNNLHKSPYPYTQFGKRCASSVYGALKAAGIINPKGPLNSFFNAFGPGFLWRFLWRKGYYEKTIEAPELTEDEKDDINYYKLD